MAPSTAKPAMTLLLLLAYAPEARAEAPRLELQWNAPHECPDRDAARAAIARSLSQSDRPAQPASLHVNVRIRATADARFEASLVLDGEGQTGQRTFGGNDCARVTEAAALIIAMALDPLGVTSRTRAAGADDRAERSRATLHPSLGLRVAGDVGALPGPTLALGALLGLQYARAHLELDASYWVPRLALGVPARDSGGEIRLYTGALRGCYDAWDVNGPQVRFGPCAGVELGLTEGRGINLADIEEPSGLWGAALAGFTLRQAASSGLATSFAVEAGVPFRRPSFVVDDFGLAFQASPIVVRAALAARWIF